ncbi:MAG TPA: tetratricopeptide repeat protein [Methylomirabilota bacterium]|nr:tetratricopeptide repeat protein [Methylomirabilota bacterium]
MPEKSLNQIPRALREQFEKGMAALQRQNYDYALTFFNQALKTEPAFYECREALRATQFKRAGAARGFFKKILGSASASPMLAKGNYALRNNPAEALVIAEQILNNDPNNPSAHRLLAQAAMATGLPRTAILSLDIVRKNNPNDRDVILDLAEACAQADQIQRGESLLSDLLQTRPDDQELAQALKDLSARKTLKEGGYDALAGGEGSYRDILRNEPEAVTLEQEGRHHKSVETIDQLLADYEKRLANEPGNLKLLRAAAELHVQKQSFDRALDYYQQILDSGGGSDSSVEKTIAEVRILKYDEHLSRMDPSDPEYAERSAALQREKLAFQLAECKQRVERYPTDLQIRFELGKLHFEAGHISEAIHEFQKAQANPHRRIQSMRYLAECFARRNMHDLAARTLQNALKEKSVFDNEKKELIYLLGTVLEKMDKKEEALEQFKQIYEVDIGWRDVAARVDAYYKDL